MKIGIFSDPHFSTAALTCQRRYNSKGLERMKTALEYFVRQRCDMALCLGDLIDKEKESATVKENLAKTARLFESCALPIFSLMGNHDAFALEAEEFYGILGEKYRPKDIFGEKNLIFLDSCYFKSGEHYRPGDTDWTDTFLPCPERLDALLAGTEGDTYIFMHQDIDPLISEDHRLSNDREIREILERHKGVKAVFAGHYHPGMTSEHRGIKYVTLPALCEDERAYFVFEI